MLVKHDVGSHPVRKTVWPSWNMCFRKAFHFSIRSILSERRRTSPFLFLKWFSRVTQWKSPTFWKDNYRITPIVRWSFKQALWIDKPSYKPKKPTTTDGRMNSIQHPDVAAMDFSFCVLFPRCVGAELCEEMVVFPGWNLDNLGWNLSNTNVLGNVVRNIENLQKHKPICITQKKQRHLKTNFSFFYHF